MKLLIVLTGLIAFVSCYDPLSDEVSEELRLLVTNLIKFFFFFSASITFSSSFAKSTRRRRHGRLAETSTRARTWAC